MKKLAFLPLLLLAALSLEAQDVPRFQKFPFSNSGFEVYLPTAPEEVEEMQAEDGSQMWTVEVIHNDLTYAVIVAKFYEPLGDDAVEQTALLESYLGFLQTQLDIVDSAGFGRGHSLDSDPSVKGVIDYWLDSENFSWSVKGWVNSHYIAVMLLGGDGDRERNPNIEQLFLNGIRFPK